VAGNVILNPSTVFCDDILLLMQVQLGKIKLAKINVYHDGKNSIFGIESEYKCQEQIIKSKEISSIPRDKCQVATLSIEEGDQLRFVSGFSTRNINYLKIETRKGNSITVGSITGSEKQVEFHLGIKKTEIPIAFFFGLDEFGGICFVFCKNHSFLK